MISFTTGNTVTNPNDNKKDRFIKVKLSSTGQIVKAVPIFALNLDSREQCPNIKVGTEVGLIYIPPSTFLAIGSTNLQSSLVGKQQYKIENKEKVEIQTDDHLHMHGVGGKISKTSLETSKLEIKNDGNELVSVLSELVQACHDIKDENNTPNDSGTKSKFSTIKGKIDSFKV